MSGTASMNCQLRKKIQSSPNLPSLPSVAMRVVDMTQAEDVDIKELAELITNDPALTTKILKTVNSPYYGLSKNVSTISQALVILGLQSVKTLVLGFSLVRNLRSHEDAEFDFQTFWRRSIYAAAATRAIATQMNLVQREEAFLAALLQDVGMPVLHTVLGDEYDKVMAQAGPEHRTLPGVEQNVLETTHAEVAAQLVEDWKLPPMLSQPIACHHQPDKASSDLELLTNTVYLGGLCAEVFMDHVTAKIIKFAQDQAGERLGLDKPGLESLMTTIGHDTSQVAKLFEVQIGEQRNYEEILAQANEALMNLSLQSQQQVNQMEIQAKELQKQANTDALTKVANRQRFGQELKEAYARTKKSPQPLSLVIIDTDHFKNVNDSYGHDAGDAVLVRVAQTLQQAARQTDVVARFGGEEFVLIMPNTDMDDARSRGESIRAAIEAEEVVYDGNKIEVTASVGVATHCTHTSYPTVKDFFRAADAAVYKAKDGGRNRVELADDPGTAKEAAMLKAG